MKKTYDLAPGNILQNMYLRNRIGSIIKNRDMCFIEVGSGSGNISNILLNFGMVGIGFDLNKSACNINKKLNEKFITQETYKIYNSNFFSDHNRNVDLIISSHVIEHFSDELLNEYFYKCRTILTKKGKILSFVPAGMRYWGIEDETAGHYRRFEYEDFRKIANMHNFNITNLVGLTFPVSNIFLHISNNLITKNESWKLSLSKEEQTILSSSGGAKKIKFKTTFPYWFKYIINTKTLYPLYLLQLLFKKSNKCMIIYCEYEI